MQRLRKKRKTRNIVTVFLLLFLLWGIVLGWGMAVALDSPHLSVSSSPSELSVADLDVTTIKQGRKSLDPDNLPSRYEMAQELYLNNCASCHIPLPPAVLPTESWRQILLQPNEHYGQKLPKMNPLDIRIMWSYIRDYSRPLKEGEDKPERVSQSRYFQALHPKVDLPKVVRLNNCASCHTGISKFDYQSLTEEW